MFGINTATINTQQKIQTTKKPKQQTSTVWHTTRNGS